MIITTEEAERLVELGKVVPDGSRRVAAALRSLAAERDALRAEVERLGAACNNYDRQVSLMQMRHARHLPALETRIARQRRALAKLYRKRRDRNGRLSSFVTGLTAENANLRAERDALQAENEKLRATRKWNIERDHEKHEVCAAKRWVKADTLKAAAPSGIVNNGLVMHLDAGDAASYPGSGTAWTDLSGKGTTQFCAEAVALQAENARLRKLVAYLAGTNTDHVQVALAGNPIVCDAIYAEARALLGETQ